MRAHRLLILVGNPMTPAQIRRELLAQHTYLRTLMDEILLHLRSPQDPGSPLASSGDVTRRLRDLASALARHNRREEELLGDLLPTVDAWGPARAEIMDESHRREHQAMRRAITDLPSVQEPFVASNVESLFHRVLEHMSREETTMLSDDVLRDDAVSVEVCG